MLGEFARAFRLGDLRRRVLFTLWMFVVFRVGSHIPVSGVNPEAIAQLFETGTIFGLIDLFAGGAFRRVSIFAMSVTPYINASIIMQLLTVVVPQFEEWSREGEEGRKKLVQWTRYGTVILGLVQAVGLSLFLRSYGALEPDSFGNVALIALTLTAGTAFLMWLGEQITEYGIGNGISLIIFAGIISRLPSGAVQFWQLLRAGAVSFFNVGVLLVLGLAVLLGVVLMQEAQRRIPVQYAKRVVGRRVYGGQSTHIPLRLNMAGVIPVIFAASILVLPGTVATFVQHPIAQSFAAALAPGTALYTGLYAVLIIFFTFFYTAIQFNPADVADNLRKHGGYIPGIRPGKPTTEYLDRVLIRLTLVGALFLAGVSILPIFFQRATQLNVYFGGTALLIVVGVALETMKQIEAHLLIRQYEGFMRRRA